MSASVESCFLRLRRGLKTSSLVGEGGGGLFFSVFVVVVVVGVVEAAAAVELGAPTAAPSSSFRSGDMRFSVDTRKAAANGGKNALLLDASPYTQGKQQQKGRQNALLLAS